MDQQLDSREPTWRQDRRTVILFVLAAFLIWVPEFAFFWRDEWEFLQGFRTKDPSFFFQDHYGHIKPVFKFFYFLELMGFGTNVILYSYTNILLFGICNYVVFRLVRSVSTERSAWVVAAITTLHPLMFNHLGWTFQVCITLHLLFQALAVLYFVRWAFGTDRSMLPVFAFTVLQHYSFGNGMFLPVLFAIGAFIFKKGRDRNVMAIGMTAAWLVFVAIQLIFGGDRQEGAMTPGAVPAMVRGGLYFIGAITSSTFFLREWVLGPMTPWIAGAIFLTAVVLALTNGHRDRRMGLFLVLWFGITMCSIPIVMQDSLMDRKLPHYYFALSMVPMVLIFEHALGGRWAPNRGMRRVSALGAAAAFVGIFLIDQHLKTLFSYRSMRNMQFMHKNIAEGTPYRGFDEPYFQVATPRMPEPSGLYSYWRSKDRFHMPFVADKLEAAIAAMNADTASTVSDQR